MSLGVSPLNGVTTGQHFVKNHAQTPDVCACIKRQPASLFRRHVSGGPHHHACVGIHEKHCGNGSRRSCFCCLSKFCQTKVDDLSVAVSAQHDVFRFDVAMDNAGLVRSCEGRRDLYPKLQHFADFQTTSAFGAGVGFRLRHTQLR